MLSAMATLILQVATNYQDNETEGIPLGLELFMLGLAFLLLIALPLLTLWKGIWVNYPPYLQNKYKPYLEEIPLYHRLNESQKRDFERKVQRFIAQKKFISRSDNLKISPRKKALIAGTAIELTFGFKRFDFAHFDRILIYENDYYSKITKQYHRGEVNIKGFVVLSWAAFEEGNADREDGINLGVHELAHAIKLENKIVNRNYRFISKPDYRQFLNFYKEFAAKPHSTNDFLRKYGKTNIHEFFAVCCENFIERPEEFEAKMPDLYRHLCKLLRIDPIRIGNRLRS